MSSIEVKSFSNSDEVNDSFENAKIEAVNVWGSTGYEINSSARLVMVK